MSTSRLNRVRHWLTMAGLGAVLSPMLAAGTLYLSNTATSGVTPAGMSLAAAGSSATGWTPTTTLNATAKYWYSAAQTQSYAAGTWNVVLWTNGPGSSTQRVEVLRTAANGGSATVLGSATVDINTTGGGNHPTNFAINLGAQSLSNQRLALRITKTAGVDAVMAFNGNDFPSRLITTDTSATTITIGTQPASRSVGVGQTATFTVAATASSGTLSYQWFKNGAAISGATGANYTTPAAVAADNGAVFYVRLTAGTATVNSSNATLTVSSSGVTLPAQIEAESWTSMSNVATEACSDTGGGLNVGWIDGGDSMTYAVTVPTTGSYKIEYRVAAPAVGGVLATVWNGTTLPSMSIPNTGGWQTWTTLSQTVNLNAGTGNLVLTAPTGGWNINWFKISSSSVVTVTITTQPVSKSVSAGQTATFTVAATTNSGTLSYQWYKNSAAISGATAASYTTPAATAADNGAVFYCKVSSGTTSVNSANATLTVGSTGVTVPAKLEAETWTSMVGVQTEACGEGGLNVGWIDAGDSLTYAINVPSAGTYTIQYRVASPNATGVLTSSFKGVALGNISIPSTGGWQTWTTVSQTVNLSAGSGNLVISVPTGGWNLNWINITSGGNGEDYTVYPGFIGVDLKNNTNGAWTDSQVYVCVIGRNPATGQFSWLKPDGTIMPCAVADNEAANRLTKNGQNYSNYFFTLAQSKLLKIPKMDSGRVFVSVGSPMYIKILTDGAGAVGFAGPNVLNPSDPNIDVNFEWYEFSYNNIGLWINTTQVDQFGFPLDLEVYGSNKTFYKKMALTLNRDQVFSAFLAETPTPFHDCVQAPYRIVAPCKTSFDAGKPNGTYFDAYVNDIWNYFSTNTLTIDMWANSRRFQGRTVGTQLVFTEVNLGNGAYVGGNYYVNKPTTQDILEGKGTLASGNSTELAIEAQVCAAFNRHIMNNGALWATPSAWYTAAPANYYAKFWHDHSVDGLAYGFCYDDVADQSSTVMATAPEHMVFGIRW